MVSNTKSLGNKAEIAIISEFVKNDIPVSLPFGDNQPYDIVIDTPMGFKSVQVKHGLLKNGVIFADIRKRIGSDRINYITYEKLADYIAIWCEKLNACYLLDINECEHKTGVSLRVDTPKKHTNLSSIVWAKDYELDKKIKELK